MAERKKSRPYQDQLIESLKDPSEAMAYLNAALEEPDAPAVFLSALRQVAEARGISELAGLARRCESAAVRCGVPRWGVAGGFW